LAAESPKNLVPKFFSNTATTYDKIAAWATFGKDRYWKKEILRQIPKADSYLDLACGTGILTRKIAEQFPLAKIVGVDISENYLNVAKKNSKSYQNISFVLQDAEELSLPAKFGCVVSSYIPKYCDAGILVGACLAHLNDGGKIILHDFIYPKNKPVQKFWKMHFAILRLAGLFLPSWKDAFSELPNLIKASRWLDDCESELKKRGLAVTKQYLTCGTSAILVGTHIA
jgi:demethylmenaquinone methyltransferase/2-methoxy-6-polyprenyl-1,4-benzoquinol methylase